MKPILFSTPMVQAILEGRKTQTRRVVKEPMQQWIQTATNPEWFEKIEEQCPYGKPGDILWVREKFCPTGSDEYLHKETNLPYFYFADVEEPDSIKSEMKEWNWKWKPSIHMPFAACRLFLKIKSIRVEHLQDINEEDAKAEGVAFKNGKYYCYYKPLGFDEADFKQESAKLSFHSLWFTINGPDSWSKNPFVWVIEFERTEKPTFDMSEFQGTYSANEMKGVLQNIKAKIN